MNKGSGESEQIGFTKQTLAFLVDEYGFVYKQLKFDSDLARYESEIFDFDIGYHPHDGTWFNIFVKKDTYWLNDRIGKGCRLYDVIKVWNQQENFYDGAEPEFVIPHYARCLRTYGASMLRGDISVCEDVVIANRMRCIRGISIQSYIKLFREMLKDISESKKDQLEAAYLTGGPLVIWLELQKVGHHSNEFQELVRQFSMEYCS